MRGTLPTGLLLAGLLACPAAARAEGAGPEPPSAAKARWSVAVGAALSVPNLHGGALAAAVSPRGHGFFADVKFALSRPAGSEYPLAFSSVASAEARGDTLREIFAEWTTIDLAYARLVPLPLGSGPAFLYAGIGWAQRQERRRYEDAQVQLDYWVSHPEATAHFLNLLAGVVLPLASVDRFELAVQLGLETAPGGVTLGIALAE